MFNTIIYIAIVTSAVILPATALEIAPNRIGIIIASISEIISAYLILSSIGE